MKPLKPTQRGTPRITGITEPRRRWGLGFMLVATIAMMAGASAPSPFYPVLQAEYGFAPVILTMVFAVYAVALLVVLLFGGSISDHVGRRPVISIGFVVLALSLIAFWHADTAGALMVSRILQGAASGVLLSTLSASVVDMESPKKPGDAARLNSVTAMIGLALGALAAGLILQLDEGNGKPLVFGSLAVLFLLLAVGAWTVPETSMRRPGVWASLLPRVSVSPVMRKAFVKSIPALFAGWATGGLYLSLGPIIIANQFHETSHLARGLVIVLLAGAGAVAGLMVSRRTARFVTLLGTITLAVGSAMAIGALAIDSLWAYGAAVVVAGVGFGTAFPGVLQTILPLIRQSARAEALSAVFVVCYLAFSVPAVVAGLLIPHLGLFATACWYGALVTLAATVAALLRALSPQDRGV